MSDVLNRLKSALADRYTAERELYYQPHREHRFVHSNRSGQDHLQSPFRYFRQHVQHIRHGPTGSDAPQRRTDARMGDGGPLRPCRVTHFARGPLDRLGSPGTPAWRWREGRPGGRRL